MNQRIKELALEAFQPINDITTEGVADRNTFDQAWFQLYNQKFAELIVQECLAQVDKVDAMLEDDSEKAGVAWVGYAIEKHFGS